MEISIFVCDSIIPDIEQMMNMTKILFLFMSIKIIKFHHN